MQIEALKQVGPDIVHTHHHKHHAHRFKGSDCCRSTAVSRTMVNEEKNHYLAIFTRRTRRRVSGLNAKLRFSQSIKSDRGVNTIKVSTHKRKNIHSLEETKKDCERRRKKSCGRKVVARDFSAIFFVFLYSQASFLIQHFSRLAWHLTTACCDIDIVLSSSWNLSTISRAARSSTVVRKC